MLAFFSEVDTNNDGVLSTTEVGIMNTIRGWQMYLNVFDAYELERWNNSAGWTPTWDSDQLACFTEKTLSAVPQNLAVNTSNYDTNDGWPMAGFMAGRRYTTCSQCPEYKQEYETRYQNYLDIKASRYLFYHYTTCFQISYTFVCTFVCNDTMIKRCYVRRMPRGG